MVPNGCRVLSCHLGLHHPINLFDRHRKSPQLLLSRVAFQGWYFTNADPTSSNISLKGQPEYDVTDADQYTLQYGHNNLAQFVCISLCIHRFHRCIKRLREADVAYFLPYNSPPQGNVLWQVIISPIGTWPLGDKVRFTLQASSICRQ